MKGSEKILANAFVETAESLDGNGLKQAATDLIELLASRKELHRVHALIDAIESVWAERYGASTITIETAYPLTEAIRKQLSEIAKGAEIKESVDRKIIGGARLRVDETIIDGSIQGHLNQLGRTLQEA